MKRIPLTQGKFAIVDDADFTRLSRWKWSASRGRKTWYANRSDRVSGKRVVVRMHREVLCAPVGKMVDHENGNGLDNRRGNIRVCTRAQNQRNRAGASAHSKSGVRGVSWSTRDRRWVAQVTLDGKRVFMKNFTSFVKARRAVAAERRKVFGAFAGS